MDILIPKKNVILDSQVLSTLMSCARLADFRFNLDLVSSDGKSPSLEMGSISHTILETYYKSRKANSRPQAQIDGFAAGQQYIQNEVHNTSEDDVLLVLATMEQYFDFYKNETWIPIDVEHVKQALIYEDDSLRIIWKAKFDLIADTDTGVMPVDHKTMRQRRDTLALNNQFKGQAWLCKTRGVIVNKIGFQKTLKPHEKFSRPTIPYSADSLNEWSQEIVPYYANLMIAYAESGYWPPNYTHCENKYGFCQFKEVCMADRNLREDLLRTNFMKVEKWDIRNPVDNE